MTWLPDARSIDLTADAPPPESQRGERVARPIPPWAGSGRSDSRAGFTPLFDGGGLERWQVAGGGRFAVVADRLESVPGGELGLCWCTISTPPDFVLRLEWLRWRHEDSSGVLVRFPRPSAALFGNPALTAMQRGFEVQIDEIGLPGADAIHRTGAIVGQRDQRLCIPVVRPPAEWNELEITVCGQRYAVRMNGEPASEFDNRDPTRGLPSTAEVPSYVGLQLDPGSRVAFRRIAIRAL